jgi:hypothetical protein
VSREPVGAPEVCPTCGAPARYLSTFGAPGIGQHWACDEGHDLARVHGAPLIDMAPWQDPEPGGEELGPPPWVGGIGDFR